MNISSDKRMNSNGAENRRSKSKSKSKRSIVERMLMLTVCTTATVTIAANIALFTMRIEENDYHHSVTNIHTKSGFQSNSDTGKKLRQVLSQTNTEKAKTNTAPDSARDATKDDYTVDQKLMRILRHVGIENVTQISAEDRLLLPTWEEVVDRVGDKGPRILGLETCKAYSADIPREKRRLAVAGPFNSGTHLLNQLLVDNCIYKNPNIDKKKNKKKPGGFDSVPWGKHQSPRFRLIHNTKLGFSIAKENDKHKDSNNGELVHPELPTDLEEENRSVLPIVMVRDPFTWWQSMCRSRYSAHWYHIVPDHCPNFIANNVEREWFFVKRPKVAKHYQGDAWKIDNVIAKSNYTLDKKVVPLWVRYHSENRQHQSLAHMWVDWYKDYYVAGYPRLMIRLEDIVFYPHETLKQVCECGNGGSAESNEDGYFEYIGDENLILTLDSAIRGGENADKIHGKDRAGLLQAMAKHAGPNSVSHRTNGMTKEDLKFATQVLKGSETMSFFGYKVPLESDLEQ